MLLMSKKKKNPSIFLYTFSIIIILLLFNVASVCIFSFILFDRFFIENQNETFYTIYEKIDEIKDFNINSKEFNELVDITRYNNCVMEVYDTDLNKRIYSQYIYDSNEIEDLQEAFDYILEDSDVKIVYDDESLKPVISYINNTNNQYSMLVKKTDNIYILLQTSTDSIHKYKMLLYKSILCCFILSSMIGAIPAYYMSKNILNNINKIKNVAKKVSENDFSEECNSSDFREFDELSVYINKMSDSLEKQLNEIEEQNKTLSEDIENRKALEQTQKDFVSNVSHELKTPISIVSGYAEGIKYGLVDTKEDIDGYCDTIIKECVRMRNIVKQLLDLSSIENAVELNIEKNDITGLLDSIYNKFVVKHPDREFKNSININLTAYCDYDEIENVITNYLDNAVKYSTGAIEIRAFYDSEYVYIGVHNDGHIEESEKDKIWDRFYRVDKSHKRNENSTGLGLSIVKATMKKHDMPYGVKNINEGIEFFIKLKKNM